MAVAARCSECQHSLRGKPSGTKTCSSKCRSARSRRIARQKQKAGSQSKFSPEVQEIAAVARNEVKDVAHEVMVEELRPIVREALTQDVLLGLDRLVKLTPRAIEKLEDDLEADDETIRQRAYTLLLRYTMGNPSVAPGPAEQAAAPMQVVFNIPRPGDTTAPEPATQPIEPPEELTDGDAEELRECMDCHQLKTSEEFVGGSERCWDCFNRLRDKVPARLGE